MAAANIFVPAIVRQVDSNAKTIVSSAWARRQKDIWWNRLVRTRPSTTKTEYLQWLLETARIQNLGNGGSNFYGDMMATNWSIENSDWGASLELTVNDIMDALGATSTTGSKLEYAASWSKQVGNKGVFWPQDQAKVAMKSLTTGCYDGGAFFRDASNPHYANYVTQSGPAFQNLFWGVPFNQQNYADIGAYIETIPAPDGDPRKVKPRICAFGADNRLPGLQAFGAESITATDPLNQSGAAAATVLTKVLYDTEAPIVTSDLSMGGVDKGTWWIGAELVEDDELSGLIFQEREPFTLRGLTMETDAELLRRRMFEWQFYGRNAFSYGHPFLLFCMKPTVPAGKAQWVPS